MDIGVQEITLGICQSVKFVCRDSVAIAYSSHRANRRLIWVGGFNIYYGKIHHPGSTWENGYNKRFNGTLRREVLNAEWFTTTKQAQVVINQWLRQYNHIRPHQALNMRPPVPETLIRNGTELGG